MKLSDYLKSLTGKELSQENISIISREIDEIKGRAVATVEENLTVANKQLKETTDNLSKYTNIEADASLKEAFIKAGGSEDKFDSFKKVSGEIKDIENYDFKETFTEFASLKENVTPNFNGNDITAVNLGENKTETRPNVLPVT